MKFLLVLLSTAFCFTTFAQQNIINDANAEVRNVTSFSGIKVSGGIDVWLSQGNDYALAVSAIDEKYRDNIKTEIKNGVLAIWYESDNLKWNRGDKKLRAYISFKSIERLEASGACDLKINETLNSESLVLRLSGACDINGAVKVSNMTMDLSGASTVKITGHVDNLKLESSGASDVKNYDLVVENCIARISGASDVKITINNSISASASGASSLNYKGNPEKKEVATSGASSISQRNN
ncbi:MAG TPA: head GIN domain-containing protein [Chitinophagaceae bacterium]|nr:head GIN domain-containing protein [Chitinophagaceae bacterium]